jgi:hypothetical protein
MLMSEEPIMLDEHAELFRQGESWFVYLFALSDCSAFKVGFSCNPLQRIYSFSHRYFERFDLGQSLILQRNDCTDARAAEAALKAELGEFRMDSPPWVPCEAGGRTEWFSAVYFGNAEERLRAFLPGHDAAQLASMSDFIRRELVRLSSSFELWVWRQAQYVCDGWASASRARAQIDAAGSLRDWLDAYRYFDVPLFVDDPAVLQFVRDCARRTSA